MKFNILKTRNGRLRQKLVNQLLNKKITDKDIDFILDAVSDYEQNNLDAIEKLKKEN